MAVDSMRKAVIDLGTNTFHLLIAEVAEGSFSILHKEQIAVKLGEGGIERGEIAPAAYERGMQAMNRFRQLLDTYEKIPVEALATSALRNASNSTQFIREVADRFAIPIRLITGEEEAEFIYRGVLASLPLPAPQVLVMDIGGGSVEFILGTGEKVLWKQSFEVGCARLITRFHRHDPMTSDERESLFKYLDAELAPLKKACQIYGFEVLVGSAGSFESLIELKQDLLKKESDLINGGCQDLSLGDFHQLYEILVASTHDERLKMRGLADYRVEMMVAAVCLIDWVVRQCGVKKIWCSPNSLKEGALFSPEEK